MDDIGDSNQGPWVGCKANPYHYLGFIYLITDVTTGRKYVGKKMMFRGKSIAGCRSKVSDRQSPKWKSKCWTTSDWRTYTGSSHKLTQHMKDHPDHTYRFEILYQCRSKASLSFSEAREMWRRDVLNARLDNGEWEYFNESIPAVRFRAPIYIQQEGADKNG